MKYSVGNSFLRYALAVRANTVRQGLSVIVIGLCLFPDLLPAQQSEKHVPYGLNPSAGHYMQVEDAKLYYETYGTGGTPLVLLHGGLYGSIGEFSALIDETSKHRRVIAIAARGHGKSEIGRQPFTRALFAKDAYAVIRYETSEKVDLLGFSDGAITSYVLAATHPEIIHRLVVIGGLRG